MITEECHCIARIEADDEDIYIEFFLTDPECPFHN